MPGQPMLVPMGRKEPISVSALGMRSDARNNPLPIGAAAEFIGTWNALARFDGAGYLPDDSAPPVAVSFDGIGNVTALADTILAIFRPPRPSAPAVWLAVPRDSVSVATRPDGRHTIVALTGQGWQAQLRGVTRVHWKPGTVPGERMIRISTRDEAAIAQALQPRPA